MPTRDRSPLGGPCWMELCTSDPEGSAHFYSELFGWTVDDHDEPFQGYVHFRLNGAPVAGAMAGEPGGPPNRWAVYLASGDAKRTVEDAVAKGGQVLVPAVPVADLGTMAVVTDPGGAAVGVWEPGTHTGFGVVAEPGAPSWFELDTWAYRPSVVFYRDVFGWETLTATASPELRPTVQCSGRDRLAGIADASRSLPRGAVSEWSVYLGSGSVDDDLARIVRLGGSVEGAAQTAPYGRLATAIDPTGARFGLIEDHRAGRG